jgi:hypothetical protein
LPYRPEQFNGHPDDSGGRSRSGCAGHHRLPPGDASRPAPGNRRQWATRSEVHRAAPPHEIPGLRNCRAAKQVPIRRCAHPGGLEWFQPSPGCNSCAQIARIFAPRPVTTQASPAARIGGSACGCQGLSAPWQSQPRPTRAGDQAACSCIGSAGRQRPLMPLLVRAWDMIIELVSTALRAPPPADCCPHRPSGQSRLAGVRAPTIGEGSQSVMTAAGGEARRPADPYWNSPLRSGPFEARRTVISVALLIFWRMCGEAQQHPARVRRAGRSFPVS